MRTSGTARSRSRPRGSAHRRRRRSGPRPRYPRRRCSRPGRSRCRSRPRCCRRSCRRPASWCPRRRPASWCRRRRPASWCRRRRPASWCRRRREASSCRRRHRGRRGVVVVARRRRRVVTGGRGLVAGLDPEHLGLGVVALRAGRGDGELDVVALLRVRGAVEGERVRLLPSSPVAVPAPVAGSPPTKTLDGPATVSPTSAVGACIAKETVETMSLPSLEAVPLDLEGAAGVRAVLGDAVHLAVRRDLHGAVVARRAALAAALRAAGIAGAAGLAAAAGLAGGRWACRCAFGAVAGLARGAGFAACGLLGAGGGFAACGFAARRRLLRRVLAGLPVRRLRLAVAGGLPVAGSRDRGRPAGGRACPTT